MFLSTAHASKPAQDLWGIHFMARSSSYGSIPLDTLGSKQQLRMPYSSPCLPQAFPPQDVRPLKTATFAPSVSFALHIGFGCFVKLNAHQHR